MSQHHHHQQRQPDQNPNFNSRLAGYLDAVSAEFEFSDYPVLGDGSGDDWLSQNMASSDNVPVESAAATSTNIGDMQLSPPKRENGANRTEIDDNARFRVAFRTQSESEIMDDGFKWRKYGKKMVKSNPNPRFLHKIWWTPMRVEKALRSQGVKGPSYKLLYGTTKEMIAMTKEAMKKHMDLSHDILPRMQPHIYTWIKLYGNNFLNWFGPQPQLVVTEPELIKEILTDKEGAYPRGDIPSYVKKLIGEGILSSKGEKWLKLRKLANHAFYTESLKHMIPAMTASVEVMLQRWRHQDGKEVEMYEEFRVLTSEVISRTAFGSSYKEGENIFDMLKTLAELISRKQFQVGLPLIGRFMKSEDDIEADKLDKAIQDSIRDIIKKREHQMRPGEDDENKSGSDFLGSLIRASHDPDQKKRVTEQEIIDECKTFYNSGQDTTTSLLSWTALLLAIHTDWQDKARTEVLESFGSRENPTSEGVARLKTMGMIINETLRLYTPVVNVARRVKREVRLGKLLLPPNVDLLIPPLALHHDPKIWGEDVHLFKPERFAEGVAKATNGNAMTFLPFGYGPRFCVGMNFATTEVKIALSIILQRYKFTLSSSYLHSPLKVLTVRPQHGVPVILQAL